MTFTYTRYYRSKTRKPIRKMSAKREQALKGRRVRSTIEASYVVKGKVRDCSKYLKGQAKCQIAKKSAKKSRSISQHWRNKPDVIVYKDGRERCNPGTSGGRREYLRRKQELYDRQQGLCCICLLPLRNDWTFDHEFGRTSGKADERLFVNGKPCNGVSHLACNSARGSRKTRIYHYPQLERRRA